MSSSRDAVLAALRGAAGGAPARLASARAPYVPRAEESRGEGREMLAPSASPETLEASLEAAGAQLVRCEALELAATLAQIPGVAGARNVWSALPELPPRGVACAPTDPHDLSVLDVAVLRGEWIVAESGAVWHAPSSLLERAAALLAEQLVIAVPESRLVATLHDVYARVDVAAHAFGWFLAGPSKTADIEQALVLGAHGPCACTVVLIR